MLCRSVLLSTFAFRLPSIWNNVILRHVCTGIYVEVHSENRECGIFYELQNNGFFFRGNGREHRSEQIASSSRKLNHLELLNRLRLWWVSERENWCDKMFYGNLFVVTLNIVIKVRKYKMHSVSSQKSHLGVRDWKRRMCYWKCSVLCWMIWRFVLRRI